MGFSLDEWEVPESFDRGPHRVQIFQYGFSSSSNIGIRQSILHRDPSSFERYYVYMCVYIYMYIYIYIYVYAYRQIHVYIICVCVYIYIYIYICIYRILSARIGRSDSLNAGCRGSGHGRSPQPGFWRSATLPCLTVPYLTVPYPVLCFLSSLFSLFLC